MIFKKSWMVIGILCAFGLTDLNGKKERMMKSEKAIFAMGCFWCGAAAFEDHNNKKLPGIISVQSGYTGGDLQNPTYENHEGHKEGVEVTFDPAVISYAQLLDIFWHNVDPLDGDGQFCDRGFPYTSAIFYENDSQKSAAEASKNSVAKQLGQEVKTEIIKAKEFHRAEEYHQDYHIKNPVRYKFYRWNCGRDQRLKAVWGKSPHDVAP